RDKRSARGAGQEEGDHAADGVAAMKPNFKTLGLVTIVAVLIWFWAEGESLSSLVINPRVALSDDENVLVFTPDASFRATVRVPPEGSTTALGRAERWPAAKSKLRPAHPGVPIEPGERQAVNLVEAVGAIPEIVTSGLSVVDVDPPNLVVRVVKYVKRDLPLRA